MYHYIVEYFDEYEKCYRKESGLTGATSYGEAAGKVAEYYGHPLVSLTLTEWENPLSEEEIMDGFDYELGEN